MMSFEFKSRIAIYFFSLLVNFQKCDFRQMLKLSLFIVYLQSVSTILIHKYSHQRILLTGINIVVVSFCLFNVIHRPPLVFSLIYRLCSAIKIISSHYLSRVLSTSQQEVELPTFGMRGDTVPLFQSRCLICM